MPLDNLVYRVPRLSATAERIGTPPIPACRDWAGRYDGRYGPLLDLTQAVPAGPPHPELLAKLGAASSDPVLSGYGPLEGEAALREAVAAETVRVYGGDARPDDVRITAGANLGFTLAMMALVAPGDEVILPLPWFFNHQMALALRGVSAHPLPAGPDFLPDPDAAAALIGPNTRAIVLVTPSNPTGAPIPAERIARFAELCRERGLWLVLDETYRDFLPEGHGAPHALFGRADWRDFIVQIYSFSKAYGVPGHRMGAVLAGPVFRAAFMKAVDNIQLCPPRPPQAALAWAIPALQEWRDERARAMREAGRSFLAALERVPGFQVDAAGGFFAWLRIPEGALDGRAAAEALAARHGLVTLPGCFFGPGNDRHLRLAHACLPPERHEEAAARLADFARSPDAERSR
ncbi:aminotransferase [Sabulicella rubraurantiaca]|uniref:aminotransferase n=1 Tax=Sabulicella rubraurantiaca TaxID=2811429 RepID=UPI001A96AE93|nr:aminotransferase [Sabulicella rubraurantiaca]